MSDEEYIEAITPLIEATVKWAAKKYRLRAGGVMSTEDIESELWVAALKKQDKLQPRLEAGETGYRRHWRGRGAQQPPALHRTELHHSGCVMSGFGDSVVGPIGLPVRQDTDAPAAGDDAEGDGDSEPVVGPPVAVVGFGRCGSTMLMRMLRAGGIPFAPGAHPASGEHPGTPEALIASVRPGAVAKLLNPFYLDMPLPAAAADWVFLWLDRDPIQQARSWAKVCVLFGMDRPSPMKQYEVRMQWAADREAIMAELPGRVHTFRYEQFIERPLMAALAVSDALPEYNLDVFAMAAVVHDRKPECRSDLSSEDALALPDDDDWSELNAAAIAEQRRKLGLPYTP